MAADEEIAGHEIAGEGINTSPILPPTSDPANTCDAYAEIEYAGQCIPSGIVPIVPLFDTGDSCDAYAEVEYAGECVNENAIFQSLPGSSVEEFDTSHGRLGCGVPTVFITSRCASEMTCQLDLADITRITWTRVLDDVSEAEVEIGITGDSGQTCCQCLSIVEPFCHELHIWRDGEEVWVGPIEAIRYERERVTIKARDSLAWLDVRIPNDDVEFVTTYSGTITNNPLAAGATVINSAAFATLPAVGPNPQFWIVLDPDTPAEREVVKVVSHAAASTSITVQRGQFGTADQIHDNFSPWEGGGILGPEQDLTYIAQALIWQAFEEDIAIGNTCEFASIYSVLTGEKIKFFQEAFNQTFLEILLALVETELNVTALGRTIVLTGDTLSFVPLTLLNDEHIMGEIEVTKDGKIMANRVWVHFEGDGGIPEVSEKSVAERYCYSLVERITDGNGLALAVDAQDKADAILEASFIAPRIVEIPDGSRLSPDTPWQINQLVPGARVDVAITRLCLNLTQSFVLTGVTVDYSESDGESVGISLKPINRALAEPF